MNNQEVLIQTISEEKELEIEIIEECIEQELSMQQEMVSIEIIDGERYKGEYNIIPLAYQQQELETKDKVMEENLIIKEVPFFEVSNLEGTTIYIASEV